MRAYALVGLLAIAGCGGNGNGNGDGGNCTTDCGGVGQPTALGGITFPWGLYDGSVPDVPPAAAPGKTIYCDPSKGNDSADGATFATAKRTLGAALALVSAGDTILLGGGVYRERPNFEGSGKPGAPITIGSYGHDTGAPILDGGIKPNTWTKYAAQGQTTVWQSSTAGLPKISSTMPVLGVYVNSGKAELALREVIHGQVTPYPNDALPPNQTQADIKDMSSSFYYDASANMLYADFGLALGTGDPNSADVSILYNSEHGPAGHEVMIVLVKGHDYFNFNGISVRAASWGGGYIEASNINFDHCDFKFNGGGGIAFDAEGNDINAGHNSVTNTRIWMNVLINWPRFNNANTGGGWPGGLGWYSMSNVLAQGNVIYGNGGEGLILWGTNSDGSTAHVSMNNVLRNNVVFDNFSINIYLDNTQNARIEQNFVFNHPRDLSTTFDNLLTVSKGYNTDFGRRLTPSNLSLADEPGSAFDSQAHLSGITVINNIFVGAKKGFLDYDDGTKTEFHGLKNCLIANNTIVLGADAIPGLTGYGWQHLFSGVHPDASTDSIVENNLFVTSAPEDLFIHTGDPGAGAGISNDYNLYSGPGQFGDGDTSQSFAAWKAAHPSWDQHSLAAEALLTDASEFSQPASVKPVYDWAKAKPKGGSPATGAGNNQSSKFMTDFTNAMRPSTNTIGALSP